MAPTLRLDPRLRVLYLLAVAFGVFFVRAPAWLGAMLGAHALAWLALGLTPRRLARQVVKLWGFAAFIVASYALTAEDPATDRWIHVALGPLHVPLNVGGAVLGASMILRVLTVILASQIARAGDGRAIAQGLGRLGVPRVVAVSIDAVLALFGEGGGGGGRGGGRGGGGGGGRGRGGGGGAHAPGAPQEGFWASVRRLGRGDVAPIVERIERQIARAEAHLEAEHDLDAGGRKVARDVAVIAGVSLTMLGIKALKVLPSIPFAPGHKLVVLTPLYIVAGVLTASRFGATLTGVTMGTVAFLLGDGRYGIFEILKHVAPGLATDAMLPFLLRDGRMPGRLAWSVVGGIIGAARFATIFTITLAVQAPAAAFAFLVPGTLVHTGFGVASGYITFHLVRALDRLRADVAARSRTEAEVPATPAPQENP